MGFAHLNKSVGYKEKTVIPSGSVKKEINPMLISPNDLADCENMLYKDGLLKTRKGFYTDSTMEIDRIEGWDYCVKPFEFNKGDIFLGGRKGKIGYNIVSDGYAYQKLNVYFFDSEFNKTELSPHYFNRVDDNTFFVPESIFFYSGESSGGAGIYMAVYTVSGETDVLKEDFQIYELNSLLDGWELKGDNSLYIPILCYNGRGNKFLDSALAYDNSLDKPVELQQQNMLTGSFYTYFSSDGMSDSFQLPVSDLDNETVIIRFNYSKDTYYEWIISGNSNEDEISFLTTKIKVKCNRSAGTVSFYQGGEPYPLPRMIEGFGNNLKITASKTVKDGMRKIITSKGVAVYKSHLCFYSNEVNPAEIYIASINNPLYFPKDTKVSVGNGSEAVNAIVSSNGKLAVFKDSEIYSLKISDQKLIAQNELIPEVDKQFYENATVTNTLVTNGVGCDSPDTIMPLEDGYVWLNNGQVYYLKGLNSSKAEIISKNIESELKSAVKDTIREPFYFKNDGYYGIVLGSSIFVADIGSIEYNGDIRWYKWSILEDLNLISALSFGDKAYFTCSDSLENINYCAYLSGDTDIALSLTDSKLAEIKEQIKSRFTTAKLRLDAVKAEAAELYIGSQDKVKISFQSDLLTDSYTLPINLSDKECEKNIFRKIKLYPSLTADNVSIKIEGEVPFYIEKIKLFYR